MKTGWVSTESVLLGVNKLYFIFGPVTTIQIATKLLTKCLKFTLLYVKAVHVNQ